MSNASLQQRNNPRWSADIPRRFLCCVLTCLFLGIHAQAAEQDGLIALSGFTMGTTWQIKIVAPDEGVDVAQLQTDIDALLEDVNDQMSTWREDSEISRFNRHSGDGWFEVSPEFVEVVQRSLEVAEDSGGAFDPTVSPLVGLWNFGADAGAGDIPGEDAVLDVLQHVDYRLIETQIDSPALRKRDPEVQIDLNAIAKGHGVDRVAELLMDAGLTGWMVEIGGEVRTGGTRLDGSAWRIGIERPLIGHRMLDSALELTDSAMATSGDYRSYFERDGVRYSHTINPATGRPVAHSLASVTVLADDCMTADAWATTLMVLGPEAGFRWADDRGIAAYFMMHEGDGFAVAQTREFPTLESAEPASVAESQQWTTFLLALVVFGVAIVGLALGVIFSNRRLRGTCGGLAGMQDEQGRPICDACTNPAEECDDFRKQVAAAGTTESNSPQSAETESA